MAKRVKVNGRVSWFGGPNDGMDSGRTAGGQTTAVPGVAIRPGGNSRIDSARSFAKSKDKKKGPKLRIRKPKESGMGLDLTDSQSSLGLDMGD